MAGMQQPSLGAESLSAKRRKELAENELSKYAILFD